ncbi:hypothetical protein PM8797T_00934 [Gimesia maris DSM 8797]|nr:hypothetical protein PM8797T_00934 [Gimesia maris DSM 8797]
MWDSNCWKLLAFESLSLLKLKQPYFVLVVSNG